ncbi:hypothetical protein L3Y34_011679 [Caenorhabditis briggsae]|uniref:Pyridoxal 5'-phosphate synthase n=1 Tax=Caenorhabditis briggsae TaxID=6238 RepID=A0AAE8ZTF3_CAEBR|nr:hypothetical protein L3Y34_011679 [Caenorhabditis briggsae]
METPSIDIQNIRAQYGNTYLLEENLPSTNPFTLFDIWFREVASETGLTLEEISPVCVSWERSSVHRPEWFC